MKKFILLIFCASSLSLCAQNISGYWYGSANVNVNSSASNYLMEMILNKEGNNVHGVLNYFFKNTYRSLKISGTYNPHTKLLYIANIPVPYYGSMANMEVDCMMNLAANLIESKKESSIKGSFRSLPQYKNTCPEISFSFSFNADASKIDSIMNAISNFKENLQVWKPGIEDTLVASIVQPRKVVNYVINNEFKKRENVVMQEIEVGSDSLSIDFYDNGDIDGDSISIFYNNDLMAYNRLLSTRSVHFDVVLDSSKEVNEISMFADNLGRIPPNTALMLISDGYNRFEARLSSTFDKNATIRIRRKKSGSPN